MGAQFIPRLLAQLKDVLLTSPSNGDALIYDSGTSKWKNSPSGGGGGGAPTDATYITQTENGSLSAEQALSSLSTGVVKVTTSTGVLSTATEGTDYWKPGGTDVAVADGGTGASDAATARTNLGLGTAATQATGSFDAAGAAAAAQAASQPLDSDLTAIAALTTTSYGRAVLALADAAALRTAAGLGTAATQNTSAFDAAGAAAAAQAASQPVDSDLTAIAALTTTSYGRALLTLASAAAADFLVKGSNLSDLANAGTARTNLGLGTVATLASDTDGTLAANSDSSVATQKAVKTYADGLIAANDAMIFKGVIDCSSNPNYPAANRGDTYRVSVAGKIGGASGTNVEIGDLLICLTDGTSAGTQAGVGSAWTITQTNIDGAYVAGGTDVAVADGGTGASTASGARTNLGLVIGTNVQAWDTDLDTWATKTAPSGTVLGTTDTQTLTNKRVTKRTGTTTSSATPTINTDNVDFYSLTAQTADITSFTTNLSGTPTEGQTLWIAITGTAARAITWGTSFEDSTVLRPATTVTTARLDVGFVWNTVTSKWRCVAAG